MEEVILGLSLKERCREGVPVRSVCIKAQSWGRE